MNVGLAEGKMEEEPRTKKGEPFRGCFCIPRVLSDPRGSTLSARNTLPRPSSRRLKRLPYDFS